jgi:arylsulfatase A-like enzyme
MAPTITDFAGFERPESWQGASLRSILEDGSTKGREYIVFDHGLMTAQRAIRTDEWKFIRTYHPGLYEEGAPKRQLYAIEDDPWEQENLAEDDPDVVNELEREISFWADQHVGQYEDPLHAVARHGPPHSKWEYWEQDRK